MSEDKRHPVLSGNQLIDSMRYGGYRNPSYALAEIIDNSFEAKAKNVEILCKDRIGSATRNMEQIDEIAIIDDGIGMSKEELWNSLTLGAGTRRDRRGIGRFGMGLPYSSISQCRNVTVYTWKNPNEVFKTYLDLDELQQKNEQEIPEPEKTTIPIFWKNTSKMLSSNSGTMVVWSRLDRCVWKRSNTIIRNSEKIIGRIYRKFLNDGRLKIQMVSIDSSGVKKLDEKMKPNDPLYQMVPSSTPSPWDKTPMFQPDGERPVETIEVKDANGTEHKVVMRFAYAKQEARTPIKGQNAGGLSYGKHASANLGVSIIRADRELYLDQNLLQTYNPLERWWGAELEFPPALDEFFGVTNNKQETTNFSTLTRIHGAISQDQAISDFTGEIEDTEMSKIIIILLKRIKNMRNLIMEQNKSEKKKQQRHQQKYVQDAYGRRVIGGHPGKTDKESKEQTDDERKDRIKGASDGLISDGEIKDIIRSKQSVDFIKSHLSGSNFFDVSLEGGVEIIKINMDHNAYKHLYSVINDIPKDVDLETAIKHLKDAQAGLLLLLGSWARLEDEEANDDKRKDLANIRYHWGEVLHDYLKKTY